MGPQFAGAPTSTREPVPIAILLHLNTVRASCHIFNQGAGGFSIYCFLLWDGNSSGQLLFENIECFFLIIQRRREFSFAAK